MNIDLTNRSGISPEEVSTYAKDIGLGSDSNRAKFNADGELKLEGNATQFDDLVGSVTGLKLYDTRGSVGFDFDEGSLVFEPEGSITNNADCVFFSLQKMHAIKTDSQLYMHIHFEQIDATPRVFTMKYRIQPNGGAKVTTWTTVTASTDLVFNYTSGTINQILRFPDIDWSQVMISSTVQFRMTRTDDVAGNINVSFIDGHIELDSLGSGIEYVK